jgi:hypothetical protein
MVLPRIDGDRTWTAELLPPEVPGAPAKSSPAGRGDAGHLIAPALFHALWVVAAKVVLAQSCCHVCRSPWKWPGFSGGMMSLRVHEGCARHALPVA